MQVGGVVAAAGAMQVMGVAPQQIAPVESAAVASGPVTDDAQAAALALATAQALPDASTLATMQSLAGLPPAI